MKLTLVISCLLLFPLFSVGQEVIYLDKTESENQSDENNRINESRKKWVVSKIEELDTGIMAFFRSDSIIKIDHYWYINFADEKVRAEDFFKEFKDVMKFGERDVFIEYRKETDDLGYTHHRFQQYYDTIEVEGGELLLHEKDGFLTSVNGNFYQINERLLPQTTVADEQAVSCAMKHFNTINEGAKLIPETDIQVADHIEVLSDVFTYSHRDMKVHYSRVVRVLIGSGYDYYIDIESCMAIKILPLSLDASGETIYSNKKSFSTKKFFGKFYLKDGVRNIETRNLKGMGNDYWSSLSSVRIYDQDDYWGKMFCVDSIRIDSIRKGWKDSSENNLPDLIITLNNEEDKVVASEIVKDVVFPLKLNVNDFDFYLQGHPNTLRIYEFDGNVNYFIDSFTVRKASTQDTFNRNGTKGTIIKSFNANPAIDVHWGLQKTFDYYYTKHSRLGVNGFGNKINAYINWGQNKPNALWGNKIIGSEKTRLYFGNGDKDSSLPYVTIDIVAHEYTHGVINSTANLEYSYESGALNESFADIFGVNVSFAFAGSPEWSIGKGLYVEDPSKVMRSFEDTSLHAPYQQPKFYMSKRKVGNGGWYLGPDDDGGVHINSGVQNFWYYLVCRGDTGTNEINKYYEIEGIGIDKGAQIVYRNLTNFLTCTSDYKCSVLGSLRAAIEKYGYASDEVATVRSAWWVVGLLTDDVDYCSATTIYSDAKSTIEDGSTPFADYQNNNDCKWLIIPSGATSITLSFSTFDLATDDEVIIYDGSSITDSVLAKYTGSNIPSSVTSSQGELLIRFVTNGSNVAKGWTASYTSTTSSASTCEGTVVLNSYSGTVTDGSGTDNYVNNANCRFIIAPPGATSIKLTFNQFRTESGHDSVVIYNGNTDSDSILGRYSGTSLPSSLTASSGKALIVFRSDGRTSDSGWSISYVASGTAYCSGTRVFTASNDTITDGSGPGKDYYNNSQCHYKILAGSNEFIYLEFDSFSLESAGFEGAINDYLAIYDGDSSDARLIGRYTGSIIPTDILSSGNALYLEFSTDDATTAPGFQCRYNTYSGPYCAGLKVYNNQVGTIQDGSGDSLYDEFSDCRFLIDVATATSVEFAFETLSLGAGDSIILYDGSSIYSPVIAVIKGDKPPTGLFSTYGQLLVRFITNDTTIAATDSGFVAKYKANLGDPDDVLGLAAIIGYEYWFDNDTTHLFTNIPPVSNYELTDQLDIQDLTLGLHKVHVRFLSRDGVWSSVSSNYFNKIPVDTVPIEQITQYEVWFDQDTIHELSAIGPDTAVLLSKDFGAPMPDGLHSIHVRFKNIAGEWSSVLSEYFLRQSGPTADDSLLAGYQYWFDSLFVDAVNSTISPPVTQHLIDSFFSVQSLARGRHTVHTRYVSESNIWSHVTTDTFIKKGLILTDTTFNDFCAGTPLTVNFLKLATYSDSNNFVVELSDTSGSFDATTIIGTKSDSLQGSDSILCLLPANLNYSSNYKIRIRCTDIPDTSNVSSEFTINEKPIADFSINDLVQCYRNNLFRFTDKSTSKSKYTRMWELGDRSADTGSIVSHSYSLPDTTLKIRLLIASDLECKDTLEKSVRINPQPVSDFRVNDSSQCAQRNLFDFTNQSFVSSGLLKYEWHFGDGDTSHLVHPSHQYTVSDDTFQTKLIVASDSGCTDTSTINVFIRPEPAASFDINDLAQCSGSNLFIGTNTSTISSGKFTSRWFAGDGDSIIDQHFKHRYNLTDTSVDIELITTSGFGCNDSTTITIQLLPHPKTGFNINIPVQCEKDNNYIFTNQTKAQGLITYLWNFGDSTLSTKTNPSHSYTVWGDSFSVKLIAFTDSGCTDTATKSVFLNPSPISQFQVNDDAQCAMINSFIFDNRSSIGTGTFTSTWNLGDGSMSGSDTNVLHSYSFKDTMIAVTLVTTSDSGCSDTSTHPISILPDPVAGFTVNDSIQCEQGNQFDFTNRSTITSGSLSFRWFFDETDSSDVVHPSKSFNNGVDTIAVILRAISSFGCTDVRIDTIFLSPNPVSSFSVIDSQQCLTGNSFILINQSTIANSSFTSLWDMGDGILYISDSMVQHSYKSADSTIVIKLITTSALDCKDTASRLVRIWPQPGAESLINGDSQCFLDQEFIMKATTAFDATVTWDFGNGTYSNQEIDTVVYSDTGLYLVRLTTQNIYGCIDSSSDFVSVLPSPDPAFWLNYRTGLEIEFIPIIQGYTMYHWEFGSADSSFAVRPIYNFRTTGVYPVKLTVTSSNGCTADSTRQVSITGSPLLVGDDDEKLDYKIQPNPNDGTFKIAITKENYEKLNIKIFNALGQEVKYSVVDYQYPYTEVRITNAATGVYYILLSKDNDIYTTKFVVFSSSKPR